MADSRRSAAAKDIPTLTELGYDLVAPAVMVAPAGTPAAIVQRLAAEHARYGRMIREAGIKAE